MIQADLIAMLAKDQIAWRSIVVTCFSRRMMMMMMFLN